MCGRFMLFGDADVFYPRFKISEVITFNLKDRLNITPSQEVAVITNSNHKNDLKIMKWGFVPSWAKDKKIGNKIINTRAETITEKISFKKSFETQRCIVPASGFYEWNKEKNPFLINVKDEKYFSMAGIYNIWLSADDKALPTFSIITTTPNELLAPIHDRMPVILEKSEEEEWLMNNDVEYLKSLLKFFPSERLEVNVVEPPFKRG